MQHSITAFQIWADQSFPMVDSMFWVQSRQDYKRELVESNPRAVFAKEDLGTTFISQFYILRLIHAHYCQAVIVDAHLENVKNYVDELMFD